MSHADIQGLEKCSGRQHVQDITDRELWAVLEAEFPGLLRRVHELREPGERVHVPHAAEGARDRARRMDDGVMTVRVLAVVAGVSERTARTARQEKSRV